MNNKMKLLLTLLGASLLQIAAPVDLAAQAPEEDRERALREEFPDELDRLEAEWAQRQEEMDRELEEWEGEQARRRDEEGEHFDEEAYEFERGLMARRRELEERRMRLDVETTRAYRKLDAEFQALEEEQQQYWAQRQRSDMESHEQEWEAEQQRRRDEEGEHFDEEAYEFERGLMARRRELQERRMRLEEEFSQEHRALDGLPPHAQDQEREKLERREQGRREALDAEFQALEEEQQQYWAQRQRSDMHEQEEEGDGGMPGPGDPQAVPATPTVFWDFDVFVEVLSDIVAIINFDALPSGPAVPTDFNLDKSLAGTMRTGMEWEDLGAIFYSPNGMSLRTVSTIEHYPPPHMDDPMVDLFVSRPNSLSIGAAPYTPELDPADNNGVVDNNDDSLIIELTEPRAAVGFYLIDQDPGGDPPPPGEGIVFKDEAGNVIEHVEPLPSAIYPGHQFVGLMSFGQPIKTIEIDESEDTDSMTIDHVVLSQ